VGDDFAVHDKPFCVDDGATCFSLQEQKLILREAAACFYVTLIVSQLIHYLNVKATHVSVFHHNWRSPITFVALAVSLGLTAVFVYVPGLQEIMGTATVTLQAWTPPLAVGVIILVYSEWRKLYVKRHMDAPTSCMRAVEW
jgi:sodium/potassium-transporting ATPase subunit alpha